MGVSLAQREVRQGNTYAAVRAGACEEDGSLARQHILEVAWA